MKRAAILAVLALLLCNASFAGVTTPTFLDRQEYPPGCSTQGSGNVVSVADTNGDGIPDLICGGTEITVLFGNGDGTFRSGPSSSVIYFASDPTPIDLNGDGKVDLVFLGALDRSDYVGVAVSFGNGDGTFQPATFYQAGTDPLANWMVLGDVNNDHITDALLLDQEGVWVFTGRGGGAFNPGTLIPINAAQEFAGLAAEDLNADGNLDLVVTLAGVGQAAVLLGNGNGTFRPQANTPAGFQSPDGFALGDVNGDGQPDLVFTRSGTSYSYISLGNGNGTFETPQPVNLPGANYITIADVNGDGIPDLVNSGVYIAFGKGKGAFKSPVYYPVSSSDDAIYLATPDLRNSGLKDLVIADFYNSLSVLLNNGKGTYQDGKWIATQGGDLYCAISADFNGDGHPDLAISASGGLSILLGTGKASAPFSQGELIPVTSPGCPSLGDANGDGITDIVLSSGPGFGAGTIVSYFGNGDGTFRFGGSSAIPSIGVIVVGDFNGDGKLDYASSTNLLAHGNGDGTFQTPAAFVPYVSPLTQVDGFTGIAAGKLSGSKQTDLVLVDGSNAYLYVLLSAGAKGFKESVTQISSRCYLPLVPVIADANGDGKNDLVLGCIDNKVPIFLNNGTGTLTYSTTVNYALVDDASYPIVADVNGDGVPDIVVMGNFDLGVFLGEGSMQFAAPFYLGHGTEPGGVLAMDLHGQTLKSGLGDLVVPDGSGQVLVILNTTK